MLLAGGLLFLLAAWYPRKRGAGRGGASPDGGAAPAPPLGPSGVEPAPPDGIHPAELGLVAERTVTPEAVSATIVDLAVRGYLRIEEVDGGKDGDATDWRLVKRKEADADLAGYERDLFAGLFGRAKDGGEPVSVKLSSLNTRFHKHFAKLQGSLYRDAVKRGWFAVRPDRARRAWLWTGVALAVVGAALTGVAAALTHAGLVPLPIFVVGLALVVAARWMPSRTPAGRVLARRIKAFRAYLTMPGLAGASDGEAANVFSPYLPYAIVLGLTEQWTMAFTDRGTPQAVGWYRGNMHSAYWYSRMGDFSRSSADTLTSAPTSSSGGSSGSGFSGGYSGGGGGGGGGGSW